MHFSNNRRRTVTIQRRTVPNIAGSIPIGSQSGCALLPHFSNKPARGARTSLRWPSMFPTPCSLSGRAGDPGVRTLADSSSSSASHMDLRCLCKAFIGHTRLNPAAIPFVQRCLTCIRFHLILICSNDRATALFMGRSFRTMASNILFCLCFAGASRRKSDPSNFNAPGLPPVRCGICLS